MVIANSNKHIAPYWGKEPSLVAGLNQLGIRNVSEQLFTILSPGLNNVSLRIRYYSFYCWIIKMFYEGKQTVIDKEFNPFIRKAELLVALINATLEERSGIPGINFAAAKVDSGDDTFSLKDGADIGKDKRTYWANSGGVLRQYYVASLEEMGLIGQNEKYPSIYNITKMDGHINGLVLADEFAKSIGETGKLFLDIINRGYVTLEELRYLRTSFRMKYLNIKNTERAVLQRMLLQKDNPLRPESASHRCETIKNILEYLLRFECQLKATGFSKYMYDTYQGTENLTSWGWYAYYLDNNWQYQFTQIFHDILAALKTAGSPWIAVDEVSDILVGKVIQDFGIDSRMPVKDFVNTLNEKQRECSTAEAIRSLLIHYRNNLPVVPVSEKQYQKLRISSENFCEFMKLVDGSLDVTISDFVKKLIEDIIYRHYRISFRKMLQTQKATQKFAFENGCLRFIDNWDATHTSPRIETIRNFLIDLSIIEIKDGIDTLTETGLNLLNDLKNGNTAA